MVVAPGERHREQAAHRHRRQLRAAHVAAAAAQHLWQDVHGGSVQEGATAEDDAAAAAHVPADTVSEPSRLYVARVAAGAAALNSSSVRWERWKVQRQAIR